jgi:hypothetical protein
MIMIRRDFKNESGEEVTMEIFHDVKGVTVTVTTTQGQTETIYSPTEAAVLRELLGLLEPAFKIGYPD